MQYFFCFVIFFSMHFIILRLLENVLSVKNNNCKIVFYTIFYHALQVKVFGTRLKFFVTISSTLSVPTYEGSQIGPNCSVF